MSERASVFVMSALPTLVGLIFMCSSLFCVIVVVILLSLLMGWHACMVVGGGGGMVKGSSFNLDTKER